MENPFIRHTHEAMATTFEVVFADREIDSRRSADITRILFAEIDRLEEELSRFKPNSDIWRINGLCAGERTTVDFATMDCLMLSKAVHTETDGAFDVTIGPLMRCWRNKDGSPRSPSAEELASTLSRVGMHHIEIENLAVKSLVDRPEVDLGAVGKGYALDQLVRILDEYDVSGALLSAGSSTILAYGASPLPEGWPIRLAIGEGRPMLLKDSALSCTGFEVKGEHIMNPRTGHPVPLEAEKRSYVQASTAALSDALSTAFMVMSEEEILALLERHPRVDRYTDAATIPPP